ncbi:MAG: AbrB/MazE/SpoVT family DNA-binding domain-containing protein [Opitutaceae bacterium]|nr:AbrB/MazE/SpoVT family DNA-binding domain-containing protein [Cytophagales bacterium]
MISKLIKIGNSQGVMLPKTLIEEVGIKGPVDIKAENNTIVIKALEKSVRAGWGDAFQQMSEMKEDASFLNLNNTFDNEEWEWK